MARITFKVANKNLDTVMTILQNLKEGLIEDVIVDQKRISSKPKYTKTVEPLQKAPQPVSVSTGKYIDPQTFKERLKRTK